MWGIFKDWIIQLMNNEILDREIHIRIKDLLIRVYNLGVEHGRNKQKELDFNRTIIAEEVDYLTNEYCFTDMKSDMTSLSNDDQGKIS